MAEFKSEDDILNLDFQRMSKAYFSNDNFPGVMQEVDKLNKIYNHERSLVTHRRKIGKERTTVH